MLQYKFFNYKNKLLNKKILDVCVASKEIVVEKVVLEENLTDVFSKSLSRSRFNHCLNLIKFVEEQFIDGENNKMVDG